MEKGKRKNKMLKIRVPKFRLNISDVVAIYIVFVYGIKLIEKFI